MLLTGKKPNDIQARATSDCVGYGLVAKYLQHKVQLYFRTPDDIQCITSNEGNATESANPGFGSLEPRQTIGVAKGIEPPKD